MSALQPPKVPVPPAGDAPSLADQLIELSALTGGLAHEIRNPLSTLKVNLQLLDEDWGRVEAPCGDGSPDPQDVARRSRRRLATLLSESHRLERILEDFLQYVGKRELRREACDLNVLVREISDFYEPQSTAKGLALFVHASPVPVVCDVDKSAIKQVLLNLLINAQQAMPQGGELHIFVASETERFGRIDVIDNGPGIAPEDQARVFDAYYSTRKGGSGLGLATARQIVRRHGGEIHLFSDPGQGTCFSILLPRAGETSKHRNVETSK